MAHRAYVFGHDANAVKVDKLRDLLPLWQDGLMHVQALMVERLKRGEPLGWLTSDECQTLPGYLSQRQWRSVASQVVAAMDSWAELMVIEMRPHITALGVDDETKHRLRIASKSRKWLIDDTLAPIAAEVMERCPLPDLSNVRTMQMDATVAQSSSSDGHFSTWLRVSTDTPRKPVLIPLVDNPYAEAKPGTYAGAVQVRVDEDTVTFTRVKRYADAPLRTEGADLGLDWGLKSLLTTSDGRRYGQALLAWLLQRDREVTALLADLQRQGIKPRDSKRYKRFIKRTRDYVENEVGRILNRIADDDVASLTVEALDLRGGGLSKTMSRIVSRSGRAVLKKRLAALTEDKGVAVHSVNPAYTSQTCSGCSFASRDNRASQAGFVCQFCGKRLHADVNAARCIRERRSRPEAAQYMARRTTLAHLDQRFASRWGVSADRIRERQARPCSRASTSGLPSGGQLGRG